MASGDVDGAAFVALSKDYAEIEPVAKAAEEVQRLRSELVAVQEMAASGDAELKAMAEEELTAINAALPQRMM